ncbi:MAG: hypothetical protein ACE5G7_05305, partial [Candidatus Hydrothermarchaeaceae archaeon]
YKNPEDREVLIKNLKKTGRIDGFEIEALTKTGKTKNMLLSATLEGDVLSGMIMDITERKKAEEEINKAHAELQKRVEELERFTKHTVSRELRMIELKNKIKELEQNLAGYEGGA